MNTEIDYQAVKKEILEKYGTVHSSVFNVEEATRSRIDYLKDHLRKTRQKGYVLGISGGVDSYSAGALAQHACAELRSEGYEAYFYAVRLPAGVQRDESDAQDSLAAMKPDKILTINVGDASNALNEQCLAAIEGAGTTLTPEQADFHKGNIKARIRMAAQYHLAATYGCLTISTDHPTECITGYFTKGGDGFADLTVLDGLSKNQVRMVAAHLGAPPHISGKLPTADLEELNPGKLDDDGFGFPYAALNAFIEGEEIDHEIEKRIIERYVSTRHKREPIVSFEASEFVINARNTKKNKM